MCGSAFLCRTEARWLRRSAGRAGSRTGKSYFEGFQRDFSLNPESHPPSLLSCYSLLQPPLLEGTLDQGVPVVFRALRIPMEVLGEISKYHFSAGPWIKVAVPSLTRLSYPNSRVISNLIYFSYYF